MFIIYSCVYKCVCQQFAERMYSDLRNTITLHLQHMAVQLQVSHKTIILTNKKKGGGGRGGGGGREGVRTDSTLPQM